MTAKIPPVADYSTTDAGLSRWVSSVNSALKALRDAKLITQDDLDELMRKASARVSTAARADAADITVDAGGIIPITTLVDKLLANQKFKDSLGGTAQKTATPSGSGASTSDLYTLEQAASTALKAAQDAANSAASANDSLAQVKATTRGPIKSSGVLGYWDDVVAARCIYWMQLNGGTGSAPTFPTNINAYLVVGDIVALRSAATGASSWFEAKQWLGSAIGWAVTPNSTDFNDVINLPTLLANVNAVIDTNLRLVKLTQVANGNLVSGTGVTVTNPTLGQIINEFDYNTPGTQAYNTLHALSDIYNQMAAHGW